MGENRQTYSQKFKEETVEYIQQQMKSLPDIAQELNIPVGTLRNWMAKHRQFTNEPFVDGGKLQEQNQQIKELETKNRDLEEEIAILKKAMHYFSKDRK
jgi:transposase